MRNDEIYVYLFNEPKAPLKLGLELVLYHYLKFQSSKFMLLLSLFSEENLFYVGVVPKAVDSTAADLSNVVSFTTKPITLASLGVATPTPTNTSSYITIGIPVGCAVLAIVLLSLAVVIHYRCRKERRTAPATTP